MSFFQKAQAWFREEKGAFSPLDQDGYSAFAAPSGGMTFMRISPGEESFALFYAPLISLRDVEHTAQLDFLWDLGEGNIVGELPSTYRFFADRDTETVYLGSQFETESLERADFFARLENFVRYAEAERGRMRVRLDTMAAESEMADETTEGGLVPSPLPADAPGPDIHFKPGFLRV